jgi:hypothetical protein
MDSSGTSMSVHHVPDDSMVSLEKEVKIIEWVHMLLDSQEAYDRISRVTWKIRSVHCAFILCAVGYSPMLPCQAQPTA